MYVCIYTVYVNYQLLYQILVLGCCCHSSEDAVTALTFTKQLMPSIDLCLVISYPVCD